MTNVNYEEAKADQAAAQEKAQRDEVNARAWHQILNKYPLRDTRANYTAILGWCNPITMEAFESLLRQKNNGLDVSSREEIIDDIIDHSHGDSNTLRNFRLRLTTWSLTQLRERRRQIQFKSEVTTKAEAKDYLRKHNAPDYGWEGTGFPKLQSSLVPQGEVSAVPTGQYLRRLAKEDIYTFKRFVKLYSADQCTFWMNQQ